MITMTSLYGLLLAGGQSSRMGENKALLTWQHRPLFEVMADKLTQAGVDTILLSSNAHLHSHHQILPDLIPEKGPLSGIHAALSTVQDNSLLLVVPVDMPRLLPESLVTLVNHSKQLNAAVCFQDYTLPACLRVNKALRQKVKRAINSPHRKDYSLWRLFQSLDGQSISLSDSDNARLLSSQFLNTNTPEEWQACHLNTGRADGS